MKIVEHYLELRLNYMTVENHCTLEVSLKELSNVLYCSPRNVKRIMNALDDEGFLYWKPGGGRGRRSKFQFKRSLSDVFLLYFKHLVGRGKFKEAIRTLKQNGVPVEIREECYKHLMRELSFPRVELDENGWNTADPSRSTLSPAIVSTVTGRWLLVDGGRQQQREQETG
ncbi:SgrR family transcriptional regulator [Desmospora activa]|uniref:Sugar transport-related sRNA regulator-like protein n=1 Tax=Desmospora activa DSM 45169 TaxID=1121389 RepID=A0A2T4ZCJ1_9BACL|nr:SgrR family transcriptional regulator [Desmospora activa]PTM59607.1 sugar transport-related sRNA regulator-like protein [Desmospora activa DSM 45169]